MPKYKTTPFRDVRIRKLPVEIHRKIIAHQKLMAISRNDTVLIDEAAIDLLERAIAGIPILNQ